MNMTARANILEASTRADDRMIMIGVGTSTSERITRDMLVRMGLVGMASRGIILGGIPRMRITGVMGIIVNLHMHDRIPRLHREEPSLPSEMAPALVHPPPGTRTSNKARQSQPTPKANAPVANAVSPAATKTANASKSGVQAPKDPEQSAIAVAKR